MGVVAEQGAHPAPAEAKDDGREQEQTEPAQGNEAQHHAHRSQAGISFNLSRLVNAARRSFELTARDQGADPNAQPPTMQRYYTQALWLDHQFGRHVAHAPPPTLVEPPIPPESEEDEHEYVEHVDLKAISLQGLREFVRMHNIDATMTTKQVVRSIVIPATMGRQNCALIDTDSLSRFALPAMDSAGAAAARKAAGPLPPYTRLPKRRTITGIKRRAPYYYVVHAWSRPFLETVNMLETYFAGRPAEHTYVWLDVFAIPQVSSNHSGFIQEIQRAIWYATSTLACFDPAATILGRLWCLYEMFYTFISKQCAHALVALSSTPLTASQRTALYRKVDAAKAGCSVKEDKKKLVEHINGYTRRGFPAINNYIRSGLMLQPYDHPAVFLPQAAFETKTGLFSCLPCTAPPPPPPPPRVPDHVAMVPEVAEPSIRKGGAETPGATPFAGLAYEERPLRLVMGACNIPHPLKTKTGGEDAYFISAAGRGALGVADGVGSWSSDDGVDPAAYSRDLMRATAGSLEASAGRLGARMALADAHLSVKHAGSSTAIVGVLPPDSNTMQVLNVGDSGMRLIREGRLAMATRPQGHAHNMPYQLACPDEPVCDTDSTVQGDLYSIPLEAGDILIFATDGMYDNVWPEKILEIVNKAMSAVEEDALAAAASLYSAHTQSGALSPPPVSHSMLGKTTSTGVSAYTIPYATNDSTCTDGEVTVSESGLGNRHELGESVTGKSRGDSRKALTACGAEIGVIAPAMPPPPVAALALAAGGPGPVAESSAAPQPPPPQQPVVSASVRTVGGSGDEDDGIGKHAPVAGDDGEAVRADASSLPLPPHVVSRRAAALARTLARTAAANMLRRDIKSPFAVELSKQPSATPEFRANPRGGKPDDVTVVVAVVVEADEAAMAGVSAAVAAMARSSTSGITDLPPGARTPSASKSRLTARSSAVVPV